MQGATFIMIPYTQIVQPSCLMCYMKEMKVSDHMYVMWGSTTHVFAKFFCKTKVDIVTLFYILLFVHWCTNDSRARDWATHDFWRSWRWIKCKGIFMTLCKTRDVLLLEPKEVGGLARWRSSFNHRHKEMILASSQRATLLMHEHCTNVGVCWCSYHFFEEAALWDFQKYWSWWDC